MVEELRYGKSTQAFNFAEQSPEENEPFIAELRNRCPGFERADYVQAIKSGIAQSKATPPRSLAKNLSYWFVAFTFVWGFFAVNWFVKRFVISGEWAGLVAYPATCALASIFLLRQKRRSPAVFVGLNLAAGVAWIVFVTWAVHEFARSFWR